MKKIPLLLLFALTGCGIEYEGDERLVVTGRLVDKYNTPLTEKNVEVWVYADYYLLSGNSSDMISFTKTDNDGNFRMIFPKPKNENTIGVIFDNQNSEYQNKSYINIKKANFQDFKFDLNFVTLYRNDEISNLIVTLNKVNPENEIRQIRLIGELAEENYWVNPTDNPENFYYQEVYTNQVVKNQTIIMEYDIFNYSTQQITTSQQNIIIGSESNTTYTLDY